MDRYGYRQFFFTTAGSKEVEITQWHERLGHISNTTIWKMFREKAEIGLNLTTCIDTPPQFCADCMKGKILDYLSHLAVIVQMK
jgi:hypothetical protein